MMIRLKIMWLVEEKFAYNFLSDWMYNFYVKLGSFYLGLQATNQNTLETTWKPPETL